MVDQNPLKRSLNLPLLVLYGLGTTIGAGIYALVGKVVGSAGAWISLVAIVAVLNGALIQIIMTARVLYGLSAQG